MPIDVVGAEAFEEEPPSFDIAPVNFLTPGIMLRRPAMSNLQGNPKTNPKTLRRLRAFGGQGLHSILHPRKTLSEKPQEPHERIVQD